MRRIIINKFVSALTIYLLCCNLNAQTTKIVTASKKECPFNSSKLLGKWVDLYVYTKETSLDSINQILKANSEAKIFNTEITEDFNLNFTKDSSLIAFGNSVKYYIDDVTCSLVTVINPKTKKTRSQKIFVLSDNFLVLQNCTIDCYTLFYIKQ